MLEELQRKAAAYDALNQRQAVKAEPIGRGVYLMDDKYEEAITELATEKDLTNLQIIKQALKLYQMHERRFFAEPATTRPEPLSTAQGVPEGWQPIETAPKDGTVIIALQCWIYHTDAARRPHYVLHEVFFNDDGDWEVVEDGEILDEDSLTHWLPRNRLPAAPEQAESKEEKS